MPNALDLQAEMTVRAALKRAIEALYANLPPTGAPSNEDTVAAIRRELQNEQVQVALARATTSLPKKEFLRILKRLDPHFAEPGAVINDLWEMVGSAELLKAVGINEADYIQGKS